MTILPFLAALVAFLAFGLATDQHHRIRFGRPCPRGRAAGLRGAAWVALAIDFVLAMRAWGPVVGPIGWVATVMPAAAASFGALNFGMRRGRR